ncbi:hypothetical protein VP01_3013g2 [Puccinia sorghi]|uniref:Uncharacterized protein n=1 Tax=Puccinia sorghi TaxID=27349 RepID=A0A0L6V208_9BASI|nr:hypothetical protein VP01_3013g2 [Puccinia sorghi]
MPSKLHLESPAPEVPQPINQAPILDIKTECFKYLEEENHGSKNNFDSLKQLLQNTSIVNTGTRNKSSKPNNPQLKILEENLSHQLNCYDLALFLMRHEKSTEPVPDPPTSHQQNVLKVFLNCATHLLAIMLAHGFNNRKLYQSKTPKSLKRTICSLNWPPRSLASQGPLSGI